MTNNNSSNLKLVMIPIGIFVVLMLFPSSLMVAHADSDTRGDDDSNLHVHTGSVIHVPSNYSSIQAAVNAAHAGDTIQISSGTYTEQILISKSLQIRGDGDGTTIIQAPSSLANDVFGAANVVDVTNGSTTKISELTVSGPGSTACNSITAGIFVSEGSTLKISKSTITNIHDTPAGGCQNGVGIFVGRNAYGTTGHAEISDVKVTKYQKGGIVVDGVGSSAVIKDNQVVWGLSPLNIASNGIQVSRGAVATVSDNKISGNICSAPSCGSDLINDYQSTGILVYQSGTKTVVNDNRISQNDIGILVYQGSNSVQVKDNDVSSNRFAGIALADGNYKISDNKISGFGNVGIAIISDLSNTTATLVDNKIHDVTTPIGTFATGSLTSTYTVK
ncbi:MAG: right-handed parallel beta-helix repeat-containing protein [Candidatus Nitrosotalea sp.]|nr:right-handed parallel beta-helix repeat-containing protein [Candidatus Nitrosotalea sp.]